MLTNSFKEKLNANRPTVGSWITLVHPTAVEIMARAGFESLVVDVEHNTIMVGEAKTVIRIFDWCGDTPVGRLGHTSRESECL